MEHGVWRLEDANEEWSIRSEEGGMRRVKTGDEHENGDQTMYSGTWEIRHALFSTSHAQVTEFSLPLSIPSSHTLFS